MTDQHDSNAAGHEPLPRDELPQPVVRRRGYRTALIWLVPALAAIVGLSLAINSWLDEGPTIKISFETAEGLEADKTPVKYKNVVIGKVKNIQLSEDRSHVDVKVALEKSAKNFATAGTRYWVVRPRIGLGGVSGVDTLLSGAFIGADVGDSKQGHTNFKGLETPPSVTHGVPGKSFSLHSEDLGSLDIGSPVYYRRIQVGQVTAYQLDKNGKGVSLKIFINGPNDKFVTQSSRFWNASGVDVSLSAEGFKLNTESLATVIAGGVAFQDPPGPHDATLAQEGANYELFDTITTAMAPPNGEPQYIRMRFNQSLRGLAVGAPVEFLGIKFGRVVSINLDYDEKNQRFPIIVGALIYTQRLGRAQTKLVAQATKNGDDQEQSQTIKMLVEHGLRAQARSGNLLTGQLYIAFDFIPKAPKVAFDPLLKPLELPTAPGSFDKLQEQLGSIVDKIQKIPFDSIGQHADQVLGQLDATLKKVNGEVLPEFKGTLQNAKQTLGHADQVISSDSPLQQSLGSTLEQLQRMARSLRVLTNYLSDHPEALIRGRRTDAPAAQPVQSTPAKPAGPTQSSGSKP